MTLSDTDLAKHFGSMSASDTPRTGPDAPPSTPSDPDALARMAFPSMFAEEPPAPTSAADPAPTADATPPTGDVPRPEHAAPSSDAPASSPVALAASGLSITLPAGTAPDAEALAAFDTAARDLGLDGTAAQHLVDLHSQALAREVAASDAAWKDLSGGWYDAVKGDKEIGGASFDANVQLAREVLDRFGPELKTDLKAMGLTNHPEIVRLLVRVGKAIPAGAAPAPTPRASAAPAPVDEEAMLRSTFPSMYRK